MAHTPATEKNGTWKYSWKVSPQKSTQWYVSCAEDLTHFKNDGYATYSKEYPGWFVGHSGLLLRMYETWVFSSSDVTLSLLSGGDDGHSVFIDGVYVNGDGFGVDVQPDLILKAGVPRHLRLISYNAIGQWHVNCRAKRADGEYVPLEQIPGISICAETPSTPQQPSSMTLSSIEAPLNSMREPRLSCFMPAGSNHQIELSWVSEASKTYTIYGCTNLVGNKWFPLTTVVGNGTDQVFNYDCQDKPVMFFRMEAN